MSRAKDLLHVLEKLTNDVKKELMKMDIKWKAKPSSFQDINTEVEYSDVFDKLKKYTPKELYGTSSVEDPLQGIKIKNVDQYFILSTKKGDYLVNTEGFDYARYIVKIKK